MRLVIVIGLGVAGVLPLPPMLPAIADESVLQRSAVNVHTVESGETVRSIAAQYGVSSETVLAANAIEDPDLLHVGQKLIVPSADGVLHTVAPGETLRGIADAYAVDVAGIIDINVFSESPDLLTVGTVLVVPGAKPIVHAADPALVASNLQPSPRITAESPASAPVKPDGAGVYTVREGDTLRRIAEAFNLDILWLVNVNMLADPDLITPGRKLRVSSGDTVEHVVGAGETLGDIAWRYSVDSNLLLQANSLSDPDRIAVGATLIIPTGTSASAPPRPPSPASSPAHSAPAAQPPASRAAPPPDAPSAVSAPTDRVTTARVTGYALGAGAVSTRTASGTSVHWGTVAADIHLYPFGTRLRIEGLGDTVFVVEDTGSAVRGNVFDVWFPDSASARALGARTRQVTVLAPGEQ